MIRKQDRLVITFYTTTDAMAMERLCRAQKADGRIIPVPAAFPPTAVWPGAPPRKVSSRCDA